MGQKEISIVLRAKNAMAAGLSEAGAQLKAFGESAARIAKAFVVGFLAAGTAVAGFAAKAIAAYAQQESAERLAEGALRAHGDEIENNMASIRKHALAIQDETGVADENTIARMARLRMLGVEANQLGDAARATIALASAGMGEEQAIKAVAMARAGDFGMLQRYIPALRQASDETEKARIVNDFLTKGYEQQKGQLNTVAGQWNLLKGRVGDVWEEFGRAIAQNDMLVGALRRAGDAVKAFGERVRAWVEGGGIVNAIATFQHFFENIRHGFNKSSNSAQIAFAAIGDGFATVGRYLANIADAIIGGLVNQFKTLATVVTTTMEFIRRPTRENFAAIGEAGKAAGKAIADTFINTGKAIATQTGIVSKRTEAALAQRQQYEDDHAKRVQAINEAHFARLAKLGENRKTEAITVIEQITQAEENAAEKKEDLERRKQDAAKRTADLEKERAAKEKQEREKALNDEIAGLEKIKAEREKIAGKRVADVIGEAKQKRDLDKELAKDAAKAEELEGQLKRGTKLSKNQQEWLDAFRKIEGAKAGLGAQDPVMMQLDIAKQNLDQMKLDARTLGDILGELQVANADQKDLTNKLDALLRMA